MKVVDAINAEYGEGPGGIRAGKQIRSSTVGMRGYYASFPGSISSGATIER